MLLNKTLKTYANETGKSQSIFNYYKFLSLTIKLLQLERNRSNKLECFPV